MNELETALSDVRAAARFVKSFSMLETLVQAAVDADKRLATLNADIEKIESNKRKLLAEVETERVTAATAKTRYTTDLEEFTKIIEAERSKLRSELKALETEVSNKRHALNLELEKVSSEYTKNKERMSNELTQLREVLATTRQQVMSIVGATQ